MNGQDFINYGINLLQNDPLQRFVGVDMSVNSAFYNMNLLPTSLLSKPAFDLHDDMINSMSLSTMSGSTLDDFSSLFFETRGIQSYVTLEIKIYIPIITGTAEPLVVQTTDEFRTSQNIVFNPVQDYIFSYAALPTIELNSVNYHMATILTSSQNATSQILPNSISSTTVVYQVSLIVNNITSSSIPEPAQTDAQFKKTIQSSLSLRNNINPASLIANLQNIYPSASISPIGYGDPEMQRDIAVAGQYWSGHFGGMTDIYVDAPLIPATFITTATKNGTGTGYTFLMQAFKGFDWTGADLSNPNPSQLMPWTPVTESTTPTLPVILFDWNDSSITIDGTTYSEANSNSIFSSVNNEPNYLIEVLPDPDVKFYGKNYRYSQYENLRITIYTTSCPDTTAQLNLSYQTIQSIAQMQNYVNDNDNRVMNSNTLIKSFIPVEVRELHIVYDQNYTLDQNTWRTNLANLINNWNSNSPINFSTLLKDFPVPYREDEIYSDSSSTTFPYTYDSNGIVTGYNPSNTNYPCFARIRMNNIDGSSQIYISTRQIAPRYTTSGLSSSYRTCRYVIEPSNIIFTAGSW